MPNADITVVAMVPEAGVEKTYSRLKALAPLGMLSPEKVTLLE